MVRKVVAFIICVAIPLVVGVVAGLISMKAVGEFGVVNKPALYPPDWLFPVVWTILYILMGIASYLVVMSDESIDVIKSAITFYALQLFVNFCWPIFFFNFGLYGFAFIWLVVLWILVLITLLEFYSINKAAGYLLIPYLVWLTFAGYLNFAIWMIN